jgi:O-antigen ligase
MVIYSVSEKIIKENPLSGIGPAGFQEKYLQEQINFPPYPQWAVPHSHNLFSQIWLSSGLIGLAFFMLIFIAKIFYAKTSSFNRKQLFLSFLIINYFLLHGLVDTPIWKNDLALFFWFFLLIDNPKKRKK